MDAPKTLVILSNLKWMLKCPHCGTNIYKSTLVEEKKCALCGWIWDFNWYLVRLREIARKKEDQNGKIGEG